MVDVLVLGHHGCGGHTVRVHRTPVTGETIVAWGYKVIKDGGKGGHQSLIIGRLGGSAAFIGKVPDNSFGDTALEWLSCDGVDVSHALRSDGENNRPGLILIDDNGNNTIISVQGDGHLLPFSEVEAHIKAYKGAKYFITGFEIPAETALGGAKLAHEMGMITILNPSPIHEGDLGDLSYIDILIPNEPETKGLLGMDQSAAVTPLEAAKAIMARYKVGAVVMTLGKDGVFAYDGKDSWTVEAMPVKVVNTIGAGDGFLGGFTYALTQGMDMGGAITIGNAVANYSVMRPGTIDSYPYAAELKAFMEEYKGYTAKKL